MSDIPRTAPSAREQALKSIGREAPAPHLSAVTPRSEHEALAMQAEAARAPDFHGLGLMHETRFDPTPGSTAAAAAAPSAVAAAPAAAQAPASAPGPWFTGSTWQDSTSSGQGQPQAQTQAEPEAAPEKPEKEWNNGQDALRPIRRAELRFAYSKLEFDGTPGITPDGEYGTIPGERQNYEQGVTTLRLDFPTGFPKRWIIHDWTLATTIEVPWVSTDVPGPHSDEDRETGLGDVTAQMLFIPTKPGKFEWGFGAKGSFPTARMEQMGTGRWMVSPTLVFVHHPDWLKRDGFLGLTLRDTFDTGIADDRDEIHYATIQPHVQVNLPRHWFIASAPEIKWDFRHDDRWYVPADLMIGKMFSKGCLLSLDGQYAITNHIEGAAEWTVEARLAFFF